MNVFVAESAWETLAHVLGPPPSASGLSCDERGALLNGGFRSMAFFVGLHGALLSEGVRSIALFCCGFASRGAKSPRAFHIFQWKI